MNAKHLKSVFIFRRDLRLHDNTALIQALKDSKEVLPVFIFDPRQTQQHQFKSMPAFRFMLESLVDLKKQLKNNGASLFIFEGLPHEILDQIISLEKIDAVYVNEDYTPFSRKRDDQIKKICEARGVNFYSSHDCLLNSPKAVLKEDGTVYTVYTPYMRKAMTQSVSKPQKNTFQNYYTTSIKIENAHLLDKFLKENSNPSFYPGGRTKALEILKSIAGFKDYDQERNFPALEASTKLSAHLKFGTCSAREAYYAVKEKFGLSHTLIRELYWRDFFTQIGFNFPHVLGACFHRQYDAIPWDNNFKLFERWCQGKTGFPIVDAGMRELNQTGFMQNRVRMITASFLIKDLHIDWQWGEKYFALKLVDYDPLVNNGNWQWVASTGCDAQPYFRVFNPWLQQKKFDPQAVYIKKWIPELKNIPVESIHEIEDRGLEFDSYQPPIVWHSQEKQKAIMAYQRKIL